MEKKDNGRLDRMNNPDKFKGLIAQINKEAKAILKSSKRGKGYITLANPQTVQALINMQGFEVGDESELRKTASPVDKFELAWSQEVMGIQEDDRTWIRVEPDLDGSAPWTKGKSMTRLDWP